MDDPRLRCHGRSSCLGTEVVVASLALRHHDERDPPESTGRDPSSGRIVEGVMTTLDVIRTLVAWLAIAAAIVGCTSPAATASSARDTGIRGTVTAGPVCPVERNPPDPSCAPRPVAGATLVIRDRSGTQVAVAISGEDGTYFVAVSPGAYVVDPQPEEGLLGTAPEQPVTVVAGAISDVALEYDTGIR
jgi:hypothetical protein